MKTSFVIMKTFDSPIAIVYPTPYEVVVGSRKDIMVRVDILNKKSTKNRYYAVKVKMSGITKGISD